MTNDMCHILCTEVIHNILATFDSWIMLMIQGDGVHTSIHTNWDNTLYFHPGVLTFVFNLKRITDNRSLSEVFFCLSVCLNVLQYFEYSLWFFVFSSLYPRFQYFFFLRFFFVFQKVPFLFKPKSQSNKSFELPATAVDLFLFSFWFFWFCFRA